MDTFLINKVWERLQRRNQVMNRTLRPTGTVIEKKIGYGPYFTAHRNGYREENRL